MALALADRVQQTGTANTTVSFTLSGSVTGFQSFAVVGNGNTTYYSATDSAGNWEVGVGTYSTTGPTLTRTTILSSSNSGSAVTFTGTVNVFVTYPSEIAVSTDTLAYPPAIGGTTPAAGTFTTLIGNSTSQFGKSSANYIQAVGAATTVSPVLSVQSSTDTNVDFSIKSLGTGSVLLGSANGTAISAFDGGSTIAWWQFVGTTTSTGNLIQRVGGGGTNTTLISVAKGTGSIQFATNNTATNLQLNVANTASAVNYVQVTGSPTGATASTGASILFTGSDAAVSGTIIVKGTSSAATISFAGSGSANYHAFRVQTQGSINTGNLLQVQGAAAGSAPSMQAISGPSGTDANIDITLTPKGTGRVNITTSIKPKVNSASNVTSPLAWDSTSYDEYAITALANALTINADANASPADGQKMMFRFKDNGTARALTWTTGATNAFRVVGVTLPTTTVASKIVYVGCIYNAADSRWDAVAVSQEA